MPCGGRKKFPRTSSIVQIIFLFRSFAIRGYILNNQKIKTGLDTYSRSSFLNPLDPFWYYSVFESTALSNLRNYSMFISTRSYQGHWWGLNSRNFEVWPMFLFLNVISALEGTLKDLFFFFFDMDQCKQINTTYYYLYNLLYFAFIYVLTLHLLQHTREKKWLLCYLYQNQLLQLCTARTAWSESDQAVRTVHGCNSWWLGPLWSDSVIKLVSVLFGKCTTSWLRNADQWKPDCCVVTNKKPRN